MNTNINFTARMDVSGIKYNKKRWEKIAKDFEAETKESIPDGYVRVRNPIFDDKTTKGLSINLEAAPHCGTDLDIYADYKDTKELMELPDSKIIAQFKKLFQINQQNNKIIKAYDKFCDVLDKDILDENEDELSCMAYDSITRNSLNSLHKDRLSLNWETEWGFND